MRNTIIITFSTIVIFFLVYVIWKNYDKTKLNIEELERRSDEYKNRILNLSKSIELSFRSDGIESCEKINNRFILYFSRNACFHCLEETLLTIDKAKGIKRDILVYFDDKSGNVVIENLLNFNDSYNLNYKYTQGNPIFDTFLNDIILLKMDKGKIIGVFIIQQRDLAFCLDLLTNLINS